MARGSSMRMGRSRVMGSLVSEIAGLSSLTLSLLMDEMPNQKRQTRRAATTRMMVKLVLHFILLSGHTYLFYLRKYHHGREEGMHDDVLVTMREDAVTKRILVNLWMIPAFARSPLAGDDRDILSAVRLMLTLQCVLHETVILPYRRAQRFEASGASSYVALPSRVVPRQLNMKCPCVIYTLLAGAYMWGLFGGTFTKSEMMKIIWNVEVPPLCPKCHDSDSWAVTSEHQATCYSCGLLITS